jgi:hypothetical protein
MEAHTVVRRRESHNFLDNRLTDGGDVVSLTRRQRVNPQEDSWYRNEYAESSRVVRKDNVSTCLI